MMDGPPTTRTMATSPHDGEDRRPEVEAPQRHDLQPRLLDDPYVIAVPGAAPAQQVLRGVPVQEPVEPRVVRPSVLEEEDLAAGPDRAGHGL